jgi:hypothetical protein
MGHMAYLRIYTTLTVIHINDHATELNYTENFFRKKQVRSYHILFDRKQQVIRYICAPYYRPVETD